LLVRTDICCGVFRLRSYNLQRPKHRRQYSKWTPPTSRQLVLNGRGLGIIMVRSLVQVASGAQFLGVQINGYSPAAAHPTFVRQSFRCSKKGCQILQRVPSYSHFYHVHNIESR
jgi:hypothetical protein